MRPALVHRSNNTSITSCGSTQTAGRAYSGGTGPSNGLSGRRSGVSRWVSSREPQRRGGRGDVHPGLERLEVRSAVREGHDLAVEQHLLVRDSPVFESAAERGHLGVGGGDVLAGP
jgi:hypothetical protein